MLKRISVTLKGVSGGLIQNRMTDEELMRLWTKDKAPQMAPRTSMEEFAKEKIHYNPEGHPCVTHEMLLAALINAGVFIRMDKKRQLSTRDSTLLPGLLELEGESWPLLKPGKDGEEAKWGFAPWRFEMRKGTNPNGGEAVCIVRPIFPEWAIVVTVQIDIGELAEDTYRKLFDLAGKRIGLGDFRPARKGRFGMFIVECWRDITGEGRRKKAA